MKVLFVSFFLFGLSLGYHYEDEKSARLNCNCGWRNSKRIVGGTEAKENEYPWMAAIFIKESVHLMLRGGGSIITPWHVMTTAHCVHSIEKNVLTVCVGVNLLSRCGPERKTVDVAEVHIKEDYDPQTLTNDIAIIVTETMMESSQKVGPVCFPNAAITDQLDYQKLIFMGWGIGSQHVITVLSELEVEIVPWETCDLTANNLDRKKTQICSYSSKGDACRADGGDPLVWLDSDVDRYTVVGIVSFGPDDCSIHDKPSVNTNVTSFRSWVLNIVAAKEGAVVCSKV